MLDRVDVDHASLKVFAEEQRRSGASRYRSITSLVAMKEDSDPFCAGRGVRRQRAEWIAALWANFAQSSLHLRRIHYVLVSTEAVTADGSPYLNTRSQWQMLSDAVADARYLGLIPLDALSIDRRASEPVVYVPEQDTKGHIGVWGTEAGFMSLSPSPEERQPPRDFPILPLLAVSAPKVEQRYAVEVWVEKSTVNDVLLPLAEQENVTLVAGTGEISVTLCQQAVERVIAHGRPTRILYISDFDPSGYVMPVSVARKLEFFARDHALDIRLEPIVLTAEQVEHFDLPRAPIKESDARRTRFEDLHGEGGVELDALEALHPGQLGRIVRGAIRRYRDRTLRRRIGETETEVSALLWQITREVRARHGGQVAEVRQAWDEKEAANAEDRRLIAEAEARMTERENIWVEQATPVWEAVAEDLEAEQPDEAEIEWPEPKYGKENERALFDSRRDYLEQLGHYHQYQGRSDGQARATK